MHQALRWHTAASELSWGVLCLMPHDVITNPWAEDDLLVGPWHLWLQLVKRINEDAWEASRALKTWLGSEGLAGGSICKKETLYIEEQDNVRLQPSAANQVTEFKDSEDKDNSHNPYSSLEEEAAEQNRVAGQ